MKNIYEYYKEINKLNETIRTGWLRRNVPLERLESVGEHIFTMGLLALATIDKYDLNLNVEKVLKMIFIHELGEIDVGDIPMVDVELHANKHQKEFECVKRISDVLKENWMIELWLEFEEKKTKEAIFVYKMDKLQAVMQAKYYSESINDNNKLFDEFYENSDELCGEFIEIAN